MASFFRGIKLFQTDKLLHYLKHVDQYLWPDIEN